MVGTKFLKILIRVYCALIGGTCGFVAGGIGCCIIVALYPSTPGHITAPEVLEKAYDSHPWGLPAVLVATVECAAMLAGGWGGWRVGAVLYSLVPESFRVLSPAVFRCFLVVEPVMLVLVAFSSTFRLAIDHGTTTGRVTALHPNEHGFVTYVYSANGQSFERVNQPEDYRDVAPGSIVPIYYDRANPGVSALEEPRGQLEGFLISNAFIGGMLSVGLVYIPYSYRKGFSRRLWKSGPR